MFPLQDKGKKIGVSGISTLAAQTLRQRKEISSAVVFSRNELAAESQELVERAHIDPVATPYGSYVHQTESDEGLVAAVGHSGDE